MKGLISEVECEYLRRVGKGRVVEIGSLGGLSASCLSVGADEVHCFDTFILEEPNAVFARVLGLPDDYVGGFRGVFERNVESFTHKLTVHEGDASQGEWNLPIDVLFIDCSVGEEFHKGLVRKFYPYVKQGGLLIHQDFFYYRTPYLAPLMSRLPFEPVENVDTSMVYKRVEGEIPVEVDIDIRWGLPEEIRKFGGIKTLAGAILSTGYVYWLKQNGRSFEAEQIAVSIMNSHKERMVWENLREAYS